MHFDAWVPVKTLLVTLNLTLNMKTGTEEAQYPRMQQSDTFNFVHSGKMYRLDRIKQNIVIMHQSSEGQGLILGILCHYPRRNHEKL